MTARKKQSAEDRKAFAMLRTGRRFAKFLPDGYRLSGVDPGYYFVTNDHRQSLDVSTEIVETLLKHLEAR